MWRQASRLTAKARSPYEATITIERWLRSSGGFGYDEHPPAPVGNAAARRLPRPLEARLLPAVRRDDGADAAVPRDPGPGRRRVHERVVEGRHLDRDRSRCPCLGRGLVRRARVAGVRSHPGRGTLSATYTNASDSADAIRALGTGRFLDAGSFAPTTPRRGVAPPEAPTSTGIPWRLIVPLALIAAAAPRSRAAEERSALASRPHRRPAAPGSRGAGRAGGVRSRPGLADTAVGVDPPALARAPGPWRRHRRLRRRVRAGALRAAGAAPSLAAEETRRELRRILSLLRDAARAGAADRGLSHGALAPQRLTDQAR